MKQYIQPMVTFTKIDMSCTLLNGTFPEKDQNVSFMSKRQFSDFDTEDSWGKSSWPKSHSVWDD